MYLRPGPQLYKCIVIRAFIYEQDMWTKNCVSRDCAMLDPRPVPVVESCLSRGTWIAFHLLMQGVLAPVGGKRLVAFIDDFNMPQKTEFGFIPALELLKHWVHYGFWYAPAQPPDFAHVGIRGPSQSLTMLLAGAAAESPYVVCRYDRQKCEPKEVQDMQLLAAMAPPSGGRNPFSQRIQARAQSDAHASSRYMLQWQWQ